VGERCINGPNKVEKVIRKTDIATRFIAVWLMVSFFNIIK
jgi:hypothetical protein